MYIVWFVSISWYSLVMCGCLSFLRMAVSLNIFVKFSSSKAVLSIILMATCNKKPLEAMQPTTLVPRTPETHSAISIATEPQKSSGGDRQKTAGWCTCGGDFNCLIGFNSRNWPRATKLTLAVLSQSETATALCNLFVLEINCGFWPLFGDELESLQIKIYD